MDELQFVFRLNMRRDAWGKAMAFLRRLPGQEALSNAAVRVAEKQDGFCVLYAPMEVF